MVPSAYTTKPPRRHLWRRIAILVVVLVLLGTLGLAMIPVGLFRAGLERRLSAYYGAPVQIVALERDRWFSYQPLISVRGVTIAQPAWVGQGTFLRIDRASARVPVFSALIGRFRPDSVAIDGLDIALVRDVDKRNNWAPDRAQRRNDKGDGEPLRLSSLTITRARFSLDDRRRELKIAGPLAVDAGGVRAMGQGRFRDMPARVAFRGGRITGVDPAAAYPFALRFASPALQMQASGAMAGALNLRQLAGDISVQAPTLKNFDRIIEAGLFGTEPIDLKGKIRRIGRDWFVDTLDARIGRSLFTARASITKMTDNRTMIDGRIHASQFDFDDLSDAAGKRKSAARKARIGPRIVPATRINLSKLGKTDGRIAFVADRLLLGKGAVFRSLRGDLALDHRRLTISNIVATLHSGRMTGTVSVDHRVGRPKLLVEMRFDGAALDAIVGKPDIITGQVRGRIRLAGEGDTVRAALAGADGKVAMVATAGSVKTVVADVLGQDLGRAIGHAIHQDSDRVPLRCLIADFRGKAGVFTPRPLAIDTGNSVGRGSGRVTLDGERIDLVLAGATRGGSALRIVDPIRIGGTMSAPTITVAGLGTGGGMKPSAGSLLRVVTRSVGAALGIGARNRNDAQPKADALDCAPLVAAALR